MIFMLRQHIGQRANRKASKATRTGPEMRPHIAPGRAAVPPE
jgi:hypothetical protein